MANCRAKLVSITWLLDSNIHPILSEKPKTPEKTQTVDVNVGEDVVLATVHKSCGRTTVQLSDLKWHIVQTFICGRVLLRL